MAGYRILDIETVNDFSVWTPPDPKWEICGEPNTISVPFGTQQLLAQPVARMLDPFPPPHACRVVAMSWVELSSDDGRFYHYDNHVSVCAWSRKTADETERQMLADFNQVQDHDRALVVTWNGRGFDLPVIAMRSLKHKVPMPWYYQERDVRYRYSEAGHTDLMDWLGDYGASRNAKLGDVARLCGLPGKQGEVTGAGVAEIVMKGDDPEAMKKVARYCLSDSLQTALIYVRSRFHKGVISPEEHDAAVMSFEKTGILQDYLGADFDVGRLLVVSR